MEQTHSDGGSMASVEEILKKAGIEYAPHKVPGVYLTLGNQLVGTFDNIKAFQQKDKNYHGWHAHHIVECDDLNRLGITQDSPPRGEQICVLIPERAHIGRINSILRKENPARYNATALELLQAYREAYDLMGDYCGGGERLIKRELVNIVSATFRSFNLVNTGR